MKGRRTLQTVTIKVTPSFKREVGEDVERWLNEIRDIAKDAKLSDSQAKALIRSKVEGEVKIWIASLSRRETKTSRMLAKMLIKGTRIEKL